MHIAMNHGGGASNLLVATLVLICAQACSAESPKVFPGGVIYFPGEQLCALVVRSEGLRFTLARGPVRVQLLECPEARAQWYDREEDAFKFVTVRDQGGEKYILVSDPSTFRNGKNAVCEFSLAQPPSRIHVIPRVDRVACRYDYFSARDSAIEVFDFSGAVVYRLSVRDILSPDEWRLYEAEMGDVAWAYGSMVANGGVLVILISPSVARANDRDSPRSGVRGQLRFCSIVNGAMIDRNSDKASVAMLGICGESQQIEFLSWIESYGGVSDEEIVQYYTVHGSGAGVRELAESVLETIRGR